jgi:hypothetical protein
MVDKQSKKEYDKEYYKNNKVKKSLQSKEYKEKHKEEYRIYFNEYWNTNKEKLKEYNTNYYIDNKAKIIQRLRENKLNAFKKIAATHKSEIECAICGKKDIWVLTIGHPNKDGKEHRELYGDCGQIYRRILDNTIDCNLLQIECISCNMCQSSYENYPDNVKDICEKRYFDKRVDAMKRIATEHIHELKCWRCNEENIYKLTIGHLNEDGKEERKKGIKYIKLYSAILSGDRTTKDLEIECCNCNCCKQWYKKYPDEMTMEYFLYLKV